MIYLEKFFQAFVLENKGFIMNNYQRLAKYNGLIISTCFAFAIAGPVIAAEQVSIAQPISLEKPAPKIKFSKINEEQKRAEIKVLESQSLAKTKGLVSKKELTVLSQNFVKALQKGNRILFAEYFNKDAIVRQSLHDAIAKLGDLNIKRNMIIQGIDNIADILITKVGISGHVKFLRVIKRDGEYRGLIRLRFKNKELTYLELIAQKDKNNDAKIIDFYDAMLGRHYTTVVSQLLIAPEVTKLDPDKILYFTKKPLSFQQLYAKTIRYYNKGNYKEALASLQMLPSKFKATKGMLLLHVQIAKAASHNDYREALMLLNTQYSSEPELGLLLSDYYFFTKQYPLVAKSISQYADLIGGDIALDNLRVKLAINQKKYPQAIAVGELAIKQDSSYEDIYWLLLKAYLQTFQYQQVGAVLDVLIDRFNAKIDLEHFYKDQFYGEYGYSKQFKKWKQSRASI